MAEDHSLVRGLVRDWEAVHEHEAKPDPHPQYTKEVDALASFGFAAYAGMQYGGAPARILDLGAGWQTIDVFNALSVDTPKGMTASLVDSSLALNFIGVYALSVSFSFGHNSSNSGRSVKLRLFDDFNQFPLGSGYQIGTGRNSEHTAASVTIVFDALPSVIGVPILLQVGDASAPYTTVDITAVTYSLFSVGEYRGELGAMSTGATGVGVQGMGRGSGDRPPGR
jgi:hypothetical protein